MPSYTRRSLWMLAIPIAVLPLFLTSASAAAPLRQEFVQAQQANAAALRDYTWKSRTELSLKGEVKQVTLDQVRRDLDGRVQKTRIGGSAEPSGDPFDPRGPRVGPVRRIVTAKKQEAFKDLMHDLSALVESYAHLPLETLHTFARQASIEKIAGETGLVRVQGRSVIVAGDALIVWIDPLTSMLRRVEITTFQDGERVEAATDFRSLPNGLTYQARTLLRYPHKQIALSVETFEYQLAPGAGGSR